jgi:hypothetical protein
MTDPHSAKLAQAIELCSGHMPGLTEQMKYFAGIVTEHGPEYQIGFGDYTQRAAGVVTDYRREIIQRKTWLPRAQAALNSGDPAKIREVLAKGPFGNIQVQETAKAGADAVNAVTQAVTRARTPTLQVARAAVGPVQHTAAVRQAVAQASPGVLDKLVNLGRAGVGNIVSAGKDKVAAVVTAIATLLNLTPQALIRRAVITTLVAGVALLGGWLWSNSGSESPEQQPPPAVEQVDPNVPIPVPEPPAVPPEGGEPAEPPAVPPEGGEPAEPPAPGLEPVPVPGGEQGPAGEPTAPGDMTGEHEKPQAPGGEVPPEPMPGDQMPGEHQKP